MASEKPSLASSCRRASSSNSTPMKVQVSDSSVEPDDAAAAALREQKSCAAGKATAAVCVMYSGGQMTVCEALAWRAASSGSTLVNSPVRCVHSCRQCKLRLSFASGNLPEALCGHGL